MKGIKAGAVAIGPARLQRIAADHLPTDKIKTRWRVAHIRSRNISKHVRLAATAGARARAPETFQGQIRFDAIVPLHGKLVADQLHVPEFKRHCELKLGRIPQPRGRSFSEDRGADAHERCAFFDCDEEIAAHSHGKLRQSDLELR